MYSFVTVAVPVTGFILTNIEKNSNFCYPMGKGIILHQYLCMQFKVPQNVQREDKIVGPLTLKQLIICGGGGGIAYTIYVSLGKDFTWITWLPPVAIVAVITILFAFIRPLDLSFTKFLLVYLEFMFLPQKRFWIQAGAEVLTNPYETSKLKTHAQKKTEIQEEKLMERAKKLQELSKILDISKKNLR